MKRNRKHTTAHSASALSLGFTGVAGFNFWIGLNPQNFIPTNLRPKLWQPIFRAQAHMNGDDVINTLSEGGGGWTHSKSKEKLKDNDLDDVEAVEMQSYVSHNKKMAVGYVKNRTYNIYTKGYTGTKCMNVDWLNKSPINNLLNIKWKDQKLFHRLKLNLLDGKKYIVDFYSYNQYLSTDNKVTTLSGELKLRFPELKVEENWQHRQTIWFVAKRKGYTYSGIIQHEIPMEAKTEEVFSNVRFELKDTLNSNGPIQIYPNPFHDFIIVKSPQKDEIIITDILGRVIKKTKIIQGSNKIEINGIINGVYLIHFKYQVKTFKLIKK